MATQKKGCGFLITAIVLLVAAIGIFVIGIFSAVSSASGSLGAFNTPDNVTVKSDKSGKINIWLHGNDTAPPTGTSLHAKEADTGNQVVTSPSVMTSTFTVNNDRRLLLGDFDAVAGKEYTVSVGGLEPGRKITVADATGAKVAGSIGIAVIGPMICGLLALVFGIIGLVKLLGSKNTPNQMPPAAAPGAPPAM